MRRICTSVFALDPPNPDPSFLYGSGSFYHWAKKVRNTLISSVLWLLYYFLSFKNILIVLSKSTGNKQNLVDILYVTDEKSRIRIRIRILTKMARIHNTSTNDSVREYIIFFAKYFFIFFSHREGAVDPLPRVSLYTSVKESHLSYPHQTTPLLKAGRKILLKIYS